MISSRFYSTYPSTPGVHCTHGFNRSGYMLVSYMVEEFDFWL